jgi:hypothetical protein
MTRLSELMRRVLGPEHPNVLTAEAYIASLAIEMGDRSKGIAIMEPLLPRAEKRLGAEHATTRAVQQALSVTANPEFRSLVGADLREGSFQRTRLEGADLRHTVLTGANLVEADLRRADCARADLNDAVLTKADLSGAILTEATIRRADLRDASLIGARLARADMSGSNLTNADLTGSDLSGTILLESVLLGVNLTNVQWTDETVWPTGAEPPSWIGRASPSTDVTEGAKASQIGTDEEAELAHPTTARHGLTTQEVRTWMDAEGAGKG